jgi:hypothetical protein
MSIDSIVGPSKADMAPTFLLTPEEPSRHSFAESSQASTQTTASAGLSANAMAEPQRLLSPPISPSPIVDPEVYPAQHEPAPSTPASGADSYTGPLFTPRPYQARQDVLQPAMRDMYMFNAVPTRSRQVSHSASSSVSLAASTPRVPRLPPPCPTGISSDYWISSSYTPDGTLIFTPTLGDLARRDPAGYMRMLERTNPLHGVGRLGMLAQAATMVESSPSPTAASPSNEPTIRAPRVRRPAPSRPSPAPARRYSTAGEGDSPPGPRSTRGKRPSSDLGAMDEKVVRKRQRSEKKEKPKSWEELWADHHMYPPPNSSLDDESLLGLTERRRQEARAHRMQPNNVSSAPTSVSAFNAADPTGARSKLHPWEEECARRLNVTANQYLINKLLCFKRKFERTQNGEGFTKTHAQQVATIDVNKVSKMWEVWERVGWLNNFWFDHKAVMMRTLR